MADNRIVGFEGALFRQPVPVSIHFAPVIRCLLAGDGVVDAKASRNTAHAHLSPRQGSGAMPADERAGLRESAGGAAAGPADCADKATIARLPSQGSIDFRAGSDRYLRSAHFTIYGRTGCASRMIITQFLARGRPDWLGNHNMRR